MKNSISRVHYLKLAIVALALCTAFFGFSNFSNQYRTKASALGPVASMTGAPGEATCTACHGDFKVNSGGGAVTVSGLPVNYLPNQQYSISVTVDHFNASVYGFQMTAIDKTGLKAGTFQLPVQSPMQIQEQSNTVEGNERLYIQHTSSGISSMTPNTRSWTFNWTSPATRKGKISFYAAGNGGNSNGDSSGDFIYNSSKGTYSGTPIASFDGDGKTDLSVFRPGTTVWYSLNTTDGGFNAVQFGAAGDKVVPGDYDGDGKADKAIWRPSNGVWFILKSSDGGLAGNLFGQTGDIPAPGDYDGDGKTDLAVYRPSIGTWFIFMIATGQVQILNFGLNGDKPVPGDYDADGKTDIAVYRPSQGNWFILQSSNGGLAAFNFGLTGDKPMPGDYDGDGKTDAAIFRPSNGVWFILKSSDGGLAGNQFGLNTDTPSPGDYDGDGKTDIAVYRDGTWFVLYTATNTAEVFFFGLAGDIPVPSGYVPE